MNNRFLGEVVCTLLMVTFISCQSRYKTSTLEFEDELLGALNDSSIMVTMNDFEGVQIASARLSELLKIPTSDSLTLSRDNGVVEQQLMAKHSYNLHIGKMRLVVKGGTSKKPNTISYSKSNNHDLITIDWGYDSNNGEPKDYRLLYNERDYNFKKDGYEFAAKYVRVFSFYEKTSFEIIDGKDTKKDKVDDVNALHLRYSFSDKLRKIVTACFGYKP